MLTSSGKLKIFRALGTAAWAVLLLVPGRGSTHETGSSVPGLILIKARIIHTASGPSLTGGMILVRDGKFAEVGQRIRVPEGAEVLEADTVIPGLVDIHSHFGLYAVPLTTGTMDGNETSTPLTPEVRALDAFDFDDPGIPFALAGGVTTIVSRPGSANVIGGTSVAVKLKGCGLPREMVLKPICDLKMTIEGNPMVFHGRSGRMPTSLMGVYYLARKSFLEARDYQRRWENHLKDKAAGRATSPPARDLGKDALILALKREIPVHVHVCTASEIMSAIRLADEFNLRLALAHVPCAYLIVDELAKRPDVHLNVGPTTIHTYYGDKLQLKNVTAILAEAGLPVSIQADTVGRYQGNLRYLASMSVRYGMREEDALRAVTIHAARGAGLDDRLGSIEPGKDADLVFLDGPPFEMTTTVVRTLVEGKTEYLRPHDGGTGFRTDIGKPESPLILPDGLQESDGFAVRGATIFTQSGPPIDGGTILIRGGRIAAVGKNIEIPPGYAVIEAGGRTVMPGLVQPRSHLGLGPNHRLILSHDETAKPLNPELEVKHAIEPQSPDFIFARQLGVTTAMITPGDRSVLGGRGLVLKTVGAVIDRMMVKDRAVMMCGLGVPALKENRMPVTRMAQFALLRKAMIGARERAAQLGGGAPIPPGDPGTAALLPVVQGEIPLMVHCERKSDILSVLRLAEEFKLRLILTGATDAWKVIPELKRRGVPVILERGYRRSGNTEDEDFNPETAARLARAGVRIAFHAEEGGRWVNPAVTWGGGDLLELAALAVKAGMTPESALRAVTIDAARIIGMDHRVGSLEPGKDADMLILKGHPLSVHALPEAVFIEGRLVYRKREGEHTR